MQPQDYVNVLVEEGDLLVVVKPFFFLNSRFSSIQNKTQKFCQLFIFLFFLGLCDLMQPTQVEIQDCCSETNLCSFGQGQCDPANRNDDCQGNLICNTNTDTCGEYNERKRT